MFECCHKIRIVFLVLAIANGRSKTQGGRHLRAVNFAIDYQYDYYYYDYDYNQQQSIDDTHVRGISIDQQQHINSNSLVNTSMNNYDTKLTEEQSFNQSPAPQAQVVFSPPVLDHQNSSLNEVPAFVAQGSDAQQISRPHTFSVSAYAQSCGFVVKDQTCLSSYETAQVWQQIQVAVAAMRVIGGQVAYPSRWPYLVSLQIQKGFHDGYECASHYCGATLIAPRLLLTATHCIYSASQDKRRMGDFTIVGDDTVNGALLDGIVAQLSPTCRNLPSQEGSSKVIAYYQKMDYSPYRLQNDIAILVLESPLEIPAQQYAKYWPESSPRAGSRLTVVGWGDTNPEESKGGERNAIVQMQQGQVSMKTDAQCIEELSVDKLSAYFNPNTMFCAQDQFVDACVGDSGGPIVQTQQAANAFDSAVADVQVGIISWGTPNGCTSTKQEQQDVGIYTNLYPFVGWIDTIALHYAPEKYSLQPPPQRVPPQTIIG